MCFLNGNRTNTGYSTGTNNQLSSDGTYNYLYDANGNLTKKTTISSGAYITYTWDYRNRLTDVQAYNSSNVLQSHIHYTYDVFDRLIERQVDPTGGGTYTTTQSFVYSGSNVILVYNGSNTLTDRLLTTPSPLGGEGRGEGLLADENGSGTISWLLADNEGTIRDVVQYNSGTDTTTVVNHLKYDSFGNITSQSNSANQTLFAYTGQMWDSAAALYYYHARWYDPHTGRFISQDPTGFAAGDANLYRYVANNPVNSTDPTGLQGKGPQTRPTGTPLSDADFRRLMAELEAAMRRNRNGMTDEMIKRVKELLIEMHMRGGIVGLLADEAVRQKVAFVKADFPVGTQVKAPKTGMVTAVVYINANAALLGAEAARLTPLKVGDVTLPALGAELPPNNLEGNMTILAHELGHALLGLTDYFDPVRLTEQAKRAIEDANNGMIPKNFGTANLSGINYLLEAMVRAQLGLDPRLTYIGCPLPTGMGAEISKQQQEEMSRLMRFMGAYAWQMMKEAATQMMKTVTETMNNMGMSM